MSECRNLDSLTAKPSMQAAMNPREIERQIAHLHAKLGALDLEFKRLEGRKVSRRVVEGMIAETVKPVKPKGPRPAHSVTVNFRKGDWEGGPYGRAWLVEQLAKERDLRRTQQKVINRLERRIAALEQQDGGKG